MLQSSIGFQLGRQVKRFSPEGNGRDLFHLQHLNKHCIHRHTLYTVYTMLVCVTHPHGTGTGWWTSSNIPHCSAPSPAVSGPDAPAGLKSQQ